MVLLPIQDMLRFALSQARECNSTCEKLVEFGSSNINPYTSAPKTYHYCKPKLVCNQLNQLLEFITQTAVANRLKNY